MVYDEDDYLRGLVAYSDLPSKKWLLKYFEMYKSTLNWPPGKPPISRSLMVHGTLREKFHSTYKIALSDFEYEFDNDERTLKIH